MTTSTRRYLGFYRDSRLRVALFLAASIFQVAALAPVPFVVRWIFDTALAEGRLAQLVVLASLTLGLQIVSSTLSVASTKWILTLNTQVVERVRQAILAKLHALPIRYHETHSVGSIVDRVVRETERVHMMASNGYAVIVPASIFVTGILVVLALLNWTMLVVAVAFLPVIWFVNHITRVAIRAAMMRMRQAAESFSTSTLRALGAIRQTRILGAEQQALAEQLPVLAESAAADRQLGITRQLHTEANQTLLLSWMLLVLVAGGAGVIDGQLTLGELLSFYAGLGIIRTPVNRITNALPVIIEGRQALDRVFALLDEDEPNPYSGTRRPDIVGHLAIESVTFGYSDDSPVLRAVSLDVRPGEVLAVTGPNGAGKTTIANLLLGFYRPIAGRLVIDGVDYSEIDMRYMRKHFGVLTQTPMLIAGNARQNIAYGRPDLTDDEILAVLALVSETGLVDELVNGLDTLVFENGPLLSGGQIQRIALARALVGDPRLLILDEPSNHLDAEGLATLLATLRSFDDAPAIIVITHEPLVAQLADRVIRLSDGELTPESG